MAYSSTSSAGELADALRGASRVLLLSHAKPDGDAVGSLLALRHALVAANKTVEVLLMGPVEPALLVAAARIICGPGGVRGGAGGSLRRFEQDGLPKNEPDLVAVVDTGSWAQVEPIAAWLRARTDRTIGVDHHAGGSEDLAPRRLVDVSSASTTQALVPVLEAFDATFDATLATALFMGLATDTGWFRFPSADAGVFALASRLLAAGAQRDWLYATLEQNVRPARLAVLARALGTLELLRGGSASIMTLSREDFAATGAGPEDAGGIVNEPLAIGSVKLSILLSEHEPGLTRASFRSKAALPGEPADVSVDVNALAAAFGGGGHVHAAGAKLPMELAAAKALVVAKVDGTSRTAR